MSETMPEKFFEKTVLPNVGVQPDYDSKFRYSRPTGSWAVWEADNWKDLTRSYTETCYIHGGLSSADIVIEGPDAQKLLNDICINDCMTWKIGRCKHLVQCDADGYVLNHGLCTRDSEERFRMFACAPMVVMGAIASGAYQATCNLVPNFIFQISGPLSLTVIEKALGQNLHDVKFLETRPVTIPGIDSDQCEICRIGMSGTLAYELRGPVEFGPQVYDLVYQAGAPMGMKRLGLRTYPVNHTFGGYPQMTVSFDMALYRDPEFCKIALVPLECTGSIDPENTEARFRNPVELDWAWMAKGKDAPYMGKEAIEAEMANPKRKIVSLVWNADDVVDIYRSLFEDGEPYKFMELPMAVPFTSGGHADWVLDEKGERIGISTVPAYSDYYRMFLCQAIIDIDEAVEGREVIIQWGDYGKRIKNVRATIAQYPYNKLPENKGYDMSTVPVGCEE